MSDDQTFRAIWLISLLLMAVFRSVSLGLLAMQPLELALVDAVVVEPSVLERCVPDHCVSILRTRAYFLDFFAGRFLEDFFFEDFLADLRLGADLPAPRSFSIRASSASTFFSSLSTAIVISSM